VVKWEGFHSHGDTPTWMVEKVEFIVEHPLKKMDDFGLHAQIFRIHPYMEYIWANYSDLTVLAKIMESGFV
jgi:hypothetical protein